MELRFVRQMRQCIPGNMVFRLEYRTIAFAVLLLVNFFSLPASIYADSPIFKYEDESGIVTFTEQWDSIPSKYRERVVTLNAATFKPVETGLSQHHAHVPKFTAVETSHDSMWNSWRGRVNGLPIFPPTQFQLGIGLTTGVLMVGMLMVRRYTSNSFMKILLRLVVMILFGGTMYVLYFSSLNAELSNLTEEPLHHTVTEDTLTETVETTSTSSSHAIQSGVMPTLQSVIEQSKEATVGKALRTVNQSNAATTQMENTLQETEIDHAQVSGQ
jgi:hypothetical protein